MLVRIAVAVLALALSACGARFEVEPVPGPPEDSAMAAQSAAVATTAAPPADLAIPAIGVLTELIELGLQSDRTVEVPEDPDVAGWYTGSPPLGQVGPAVLIGHVGSHTGPGIFWRLAELQPGDAVHLRSVDGTVVSFAVQRVEQYPKHEFPTEHVYGNTEGPELRLITRGGVFDPAERSYRGNIVVYASAVS
jgi:hypothetical protein